MLLSWSVLQAAAAVSPFVSWSSKSSHMRLYWHTGIRDSSDGDHQRVHQDPVPFIASNILPIRWTKRVVSHWHLSYTRSHRTVVLIEVQASRRLSRVEIGSPMPILHESNDAPLDLVSWRGRSHRRVRGVPPQVWVSTSTPEHHC